MKTKAKKTDPVRQPIERINSLPSQGLTQAQAAKRMESGWNNAPVDPPSKSVQEIITSNLFTYFNLIFGIIAALLIFVGGLPGSYLSPGNYRKYSGRYYPGNSLQKSSG